MRMPTLLGDGSEGAAGELGGGTATTLGAGAGPAVPWLPGWYWSTARKAANPFSSAIRWTAGSGEMIATRLPSRME